MSGKVSIKKAPDFRSGLLRRGFLLIHFFVDKDNYSSDLPTASQKRTLRVALRQASHVSIHLSSG